MAWTDDVRGVLIDRMRTVGCNEGLSDEVRAKAVAVPGLWSGGQAPAAIADAMDVSVAAALRAVQGAPAPGLDKELVAEAGEANALALEARDLIRDELREIEVDEELPSEVRAEAVELRSRWPRPLILGLILKLIRSAVERRARRRAERERAAAGADSIEEAGSIREEAKAQAHGIVADAHEEAGRMRLEGQDAARNTRSVAEATLLEAKRAAAGVREQARDEADSMLTLARKDAAEIAQAGQKHALKVAAENDHELKHRSETSQTAVQKIIQEAHKTERGIITKAERQAAEVLQEAEAEAQSIRKAAMKRAAGER